jgi:hypothetical protein
MIYRAMFRWYEKCCLWHTTIYRVMFRWYENYCPNYVNIKPKACISPSKLILTSYLTSKSLLTANLFRFVPHFAGQNTKLGRATASLHARINKHGDEMLLERRAGPRELSAAKKKTRSDIDIPVDIKGTCDGEIM